jgi:hypothetical protein
VWTSDKAPVAARAAVLRKDWTQPMVAVALFSEYSTGQGRWTTARAFQIGKCAEALALRKSFTEDLSGLYTEDELDNVTDNPQPPDPAFVDDPPATRDDSGFLRAAIDPLSDQAKTWLFGVAQADKIPNIDRGQLRRSHRDRLAWHIVVAQRIKPSGPDVADADEPVPHDVHDDTEPA